MRKSSSSGQHMSAPHMTDFLPPKDVQEEWRLPHLPDTANPKATPIRPVLPNGEITGNLQWSKAARDKRVALLKQTLGIEIPNLSGQLSDLQPESLKGNIEHYVGMTKIPTGIIGPIVVKGSVASGEFYVPMATTEGALVASYNRGARATRQSGGVRSICVAEEIQRAPAFKFETLLKAGEFLAWATSQIVHFEEIVRKTSNHARYTGLKANLEGNVVILIFSFTTGEASGQNMVTLCTEAICRYLLLKCPTQPSHWFIEGNFSGDKKATVTSLSSVRGKKVVAEALVPPHVIQKTLKTTAADIAQYWLTSVVGTVQSGGIGLQGHFANGLTAMYLATGQDVACVAEAYTGITRMEVVEKGALYISVTLPSLAVGTIGGGTSLPTQRECLDIMECTGPGSAKKLAEIMAAVILGGELSIAAAMASHDFVKAHKSLGRRK